MPAKPAHDQANDSDANASHSNASQSHDGRALLVLEDGRSFVGRSFGAAGETLGEAVFSTAMTGYQETLTDPSYRRQVVVATSPHIGNTGWNDEDDESRRIWVAGLVVREYSPWPSNWRSRRSLADELVAQGVVAVSDVDTRALTRHLRDRGAMRIGLSTIESDPQALLRRVLASPVMAGADLVDEVSVEQAYVIPPAGDGSGNGLRVVCVDLGIKAMTPQRLAERGMEVHVVPASIDFEQVQALRPDGVFFSNGPGDPAVADKPVALLRQVLAAGIPYFGICFGNQIFGRALGFDTFKLAYGHRGINQPVMDLTTRKVEITAHNHGFAVAATAGEEHDTPYGTARVSHVNLNDDVVEGLELVRDHGVVGFSVQYHPEAAAGPHDASYLFDRFAEVMRGIRATEEPLDAAQESGVSAKRSPRSFHAERGVRATEEPLDAAQESGVSAKRSPRSSHTQGVDSEGVC